MNTKSNIQITIEEENVKSYFKQALSNIVESYTIKGNVFAISNQNTPVEINDGYFMEEQTFDSLNDCIKEMKLNQAVSINEDKFILGTIKKHLADCDENKKVLDIKYLQYIR